MSDVGFKHGVIRGLNNVSSVKIEKGKMIHVVFLKNRVDMMFNSSANWFFNWKRWYILYVSDVGHMMFNSSAYWCFSWERWYILYVSDVGQVVGVL